MIKNLTINARKPKGIWGRLMIKKMNLTHKEMTLWAFDKLNISTCTKIADIGCGGGNAVKILSKANESSKIYGIDYSDLSVERAIKKNKTAVKQGRVKIIKGSVSSLPFNDSSLDLAVAVETIYFWPNPQSDFAEVNRVIKQGGKFAVICEMVKNEDGTGAHSEVAELLQLHYFKRSEVVSLMQGAGFVNVNAFDNEENGWLLVTGEKA
ncbi:MAG: class I SAM-dependent methyltransferase [Acutalibacteraceae bacterium]